VCLGFVILLVDGRTSAAVSSFKFGTFRLFKTDGLREVGFVGAIRTGKSFERGMFVKNIG
jgi:hypothetical protein